MNDLSAHPSRKILLCVTTGGFTHAAPVFKIGRALAERGHIIEFATLDGQEHWIDGYPFINKTHLLGPGPTKEQLNGHYSRMQAWDVSKGIGEAMQSKYLWDSFWPRTYHGLKAIIDDSTNRPSMIISDFFAEAVVDIHVEYKLPIAVVYPNMPSFMMPCPYIPGQPGFQLPGTTTSEHASIWLRLRNEFFFLPDIPEMFRYMKRLKQMRRENGVFYGLHRPTKPDYLVFVNSFFGLEIPRDLPPTCAPVGPLLSPKYSSLDTSCDVFLTRHRKVLYIALGTHIRLSTESVLDILNGILPLLASDLITGIIWSLPSHHQRALPHGQVIRAAGNFTLGELLSNAHPNVLIQSFTPQRAILAHQSTVLYLTHAGGSSANEGLYHGVPMLCLPFFADQIANTSRLVEAGVAESLDKFTFTSEQVHDKAKQILMSGDSGSYARNILRLKRIARVAVRGKEVAADLVEEVMFDNELRLKGGKELRPMFLQTADMRMSFWKARNWDLYAVVVLAVGGCVGIGGYAGHFLWDRQQMLIKTAETMVGRVLDGAKGFLK